MCNHILIFFHSVTPFSERNNVYPSPLESRANPFPGKLLRLRKELPWTAPCAIAQADFLLDIYPLFNSEHLVEQHLVKIKSSRIVEKLNHELEEWDKIPNDYKGAFREPRPARGHRKYLADDEHGLLVEDMTPLKARDIKLLEFKPKWLTQSRSAPEFSKRCRTCAKRARTNAERIKVGEPLLHRFCPLDLVSKDDAALYRAARAILGLSHPISPIGFKRLYRMSRWARKSLLLPRLANLQSSLDPVGVFAADPMDKGFLTAMTLRDCSLYLQVPEHDLSAPIIAKIGDLDLKRPEKADYWKDVERPLLEEGWYLGTEREEHQQPFDCNLFPEYWTPKHLKAALRPKRWSDPVTEEIA
jgi:inositol-pentakisphosphate 2-kinase